MKEIVNKFGATFTREGGDVYKLLSSKNPIQLFNIAMIKFIDNLVLI